MSLVGTRPPTVDEWEQYELHHRSRMSTKPGITGMWQVSGRSDITDFEEVLKLDTGYIDKRYWFLNYMENTDQNNALNEDLKDIQKMVDVVKQDGEVSLQYMKSFEHDQLMYEEGRLAEIKNTEREKKRADMAQSRIKELEAELKKYRKKTTA